MSHSHVARRAPTVSPAEDKHIAPLERLRAKGDLTEGEYKALLKYKHHSRNADGVAFHGDRYREAVQAIGMRSALVVDRVVCAEQPLERGDLALGWRTPATARAAATDILKAAGGHLARLWGM